MTLGYTSMDKVLIRKKDHGAPTKHLCGGPTLFPRALPGRRGRLRQRARRGRDRPMTKTSSPGQINLENPAPISARREHRQRHQLGQQRIQPLSPPAIYYSMSLLNNKRPGAWPVRCIRYTRYRRVKVYLSDLHKLEWLRFLGYSARYPLQARIRSGQAVPS
jgi:hypothetical protein